MNASYDLTCRMVVIPYQKKIIVYDNRLYVQTAINHKNRK